ncbi:tail fiber assembly protein [Pseudomonas koreensis]|nr:tail fiber assembly protein [Pseudomonas koreensis]
MEGEPAEPRAMPEFQQVVGAIDWSQLVTAQMKAATAAAAQLTQMKAVLASKNASANAQILRIQDRVDTLGYGIDAGEATEADEAEQAALLVSLKSWKAYKFSLGKVTSQPAWPTAPAWPAEPPIPEIEASPMARPADEI